LVFALAVAVISLAAYSGFFGLRLMESDAVSHLISHSGTGAYEAWRVLTQTQDYYIMPAYQYRPVQSLIWWFIFLFNGLDFGAFHMANFLLHAANSVLVFFLARRLIPAKGGFFAFIAAVVFALHPLHLNTVTFVSRLPELLVAFFLLASLLSLAIFLESNRRRFFLLSFVFCFFGIFSKEGGAFIPFVLFCYCMVFLREKKPLSRLTQSLRLCTPFFFQIFIYALSAWLVLGGAPRDVSYFTSPRSQVVIIFFRLLFYPIDFLNSQFATNSGNSAFFKAALPVFASPTVDAAFLLSFAAFTLFLLWFFSRKKSRREALFLLCWIFVFAFGLAAYNYVLPWYLYVPSIPFVVLFALFLEKSAKKIKRSKRSAAAFALIALLFLQFVALSPLFVDYQQLRIAGGITSGYSAKAVEALSGLPAGSTVYLINAPTYLYLAPENGFYYDILMVTEGSMQAMADFSFPTNPIAVFSITSIGILSYPLDKKDFPFVQKGRCTFQVESRNPVAGRVYIAEWLKQINDGRSKSVLVQTNFPGIQRIEITLPMEECNSAYFLFFDGKTLQLIRIKDAAVLKTVE